MADTKAQKVWRRTKIGACMVVGSAIVLYFASRESTGSVLLVGAALVALYGLLELMMLGRFAKLGVSLQLLVAWLVALCFGLLAVLTRHRTFFPEGDIAQHSLLSRLPDYHGNYWLELGVIAAISLLLSLRRPSATGEEERAPLWLGPSLTVWAVLPLFWLHHIRADWGMSGLVALILLSKIGDTAGYFTGNAIGKSHPFPNISPGKTTAGCVGSLVAGTLVGGACVALDLLPQSRLGFAGGFLCGALLNVAAQAGDLLESRVKRIAGVKDSGTRFGPAGGFLDLTDSLLLTVPVAVLTWPHLFNGITE